MSFEYVEEEEEKTEEATNQESQQVQRIESVTPFYTYILIGLIVIVWLFQMAFDSVPTQVRGADRTILVAGFVKILFLNGEYWRILTSGTVHGGIIHLAFNSYALYVLGKAFEFLSNRSHLAIVFLLSIIGGNILSLIFLPNDSSLGASGGVVGFLGYLTAYGFKRRKILSNDFLKNMLFNVGFMLFMGIFVIPNATKIQVDNYAHIGGLLVGLIYGFIQVPSDLYKDPREASNLLKIFGYIALGIYILTCIFSILLLSGVIQFDYSFLNQ